MVKVKKATKKVEVDLSQYHDSETGELLSSAVKEGTKVIIHEQTDKVVISSSDYAVIDTQALKVMTQILNNSDLANVIKMAVVVRTPMSVIYNGSRPHTNETLQRYLEVRSESMYIKLIKRLMKVGILYQIKGLIYGEVRVCYMLNPFISRKGRLYDEKVTTIFKEFKKETLQIG